MKLNKLIVLKIIIAACCGILLGVLLGKVIRPMQWMPSDAHSIPTNTPLLVQPFSDYR